MGFTERDVINIWTEIVVKYRFRTILIEISSIIRAIYCISGTQSGRCQPQSMSSKQHCRRLYNITYIHTYNSYNNIFCGIPSLTIAYSRRYTIR